MKNVSVKQDEKVNIPVEILATSICAIAAGIKNLRKGPLGERTLLLLISENCQKKNSRGNTSKTQGKPEPCKNCLGQY